MLQFREALAQNIEVEQKELGIELALYHRMSSNLKKLSLVLRTGIKNNVRKQLESQTYILVYCIGIVSSLSSSGYDTAVVMYILCTLPINRTEVRMDHW